MSELESDEMSKEDTEDKEKVGPVLEELGLDSKAEKGLSRIIHSAERASVMRASVFPKWGGIVFDSNPLHRNIEYAQEKGLEAIPTFATLLAADAEQYALGLVKALNDFGTPLNLVGLDTEFKGWVSVNKEIRWRFENSRRNSEGLCLRAKGIVGKEEAVRTEIFVAKQTPQLSTAEILDKYLQHVDVASSTAYATFEISQEKTRDFLEFLDDCKPILSMRKRYRVQEGIPYMFPASFIPATLLNIISTASGIPEGLYLSAKFRFYNPPQPGEIRNIIVLPREPKEVNEDASRTGESSYVYRFKALQIQRKSKEIREATPILTADSIVLSKHKLDFKHKLDSDQTA